jgi:hypothetical protein
VVVIDTVTLIAGLVGVAVVASSLAVGFWIGRSMTRNESTQLRTTAKELMQVRLQMRNQLEAARQAVGRLVADPRTSPHDRLALEDHIAPLLVQRNETGEFTRLETERFWKLGR